MTDKHIIDEVDVRECNCYIEGERGMTCVGTFISSNCSKNPNCYYKQLKRKEQECNKLYIQLEADEEYHKEMENTLRKIIKNKRERNLELYKENNKLKQTIKEIKEIIKENFYFLDCDYRWILEQILQKISECEVKNEP